MECTGGVVFRDRLTVHLIRRRLGLLVSTQSIDACCRRGNSVSVETCGIGRRTSEEGEKQEVIPPCVRDGC